MALSGITRRFRGSGRLGAGDRDLLIGAAADRTFACPGCGRPLAIGQNQCPGCGSVLIAGVLLRTAFFLVLVGGVLGMMAGALAAGVVLTPRLAAGEAALAELAAAATPAVAPSGGPAATAPVVRSGLPRDAAASLVQVAAVNGRLERARVQLVKLSSARAPSAGQIAQILRKVAADARSASAAADRLAAWEPGAELAAAAASLYATAGTVAGDGLAAPLADAAAYKSSAKRMAKVLGSLPPINAAAAALAAETGIHLPALTPEP